MHLILVFISLTLSETTLRVVNSEAVGPYMGWSSWSLESTLWPGLGTSWLKEENILKQIDAMSEKLRDYGYTYINIDSGWNAYDDIYDRNTNFDQNGRPIPNPERFPQGMKWLADYAHSKGLKLGLYAPVGLPMGVFGPDESNKTNFPVYGTSNCTGFDLVYSDWRTTNGWDSSYKMDFSNPCSHSFIDSITQQLADWGIDFFKLDGVGPSGSWNNDTNYDNREDVAAWRAGFDKTGREIILEISWALDINFVDTWTQYVNGWRIDGDVECYCDTLVKWDASVVQRFSHLPPWIDFAGPGRWNDLDSLNVGNGTMDGLTDDERQTYATLWAISCAPLYIGDDLTLLDEYGLSLLTNTEVIDINQNGMPARPVETGVFTQVWWAKRDDGSFVVGLFNLLDIGENVSAQWEYFGFEGDAEVRDVWARSDLGIFTDEFTELVPRHGSRLIVVRPL